MTETRLALEDDKTERDTAAARALWEDLARRARGVHCPQHFVEPWRVTVLGDRPQKLRLYVSGCCPGLGEAVDQMIRSDPRTSGSR